MKVTTTKCGDIKVSIGYEEESDKVVSLKIDIESLSPENILTSMEILKGVLDLGTQGNVDES